MRVYKGGLEWRRGVASEAQYQHTQFRVSSLDHSSFISYILNMVRVNFLYIEHGKGKYKVLLFYQELRWLGYGLNDWNSARAEVSPFPSTS
jgi:hypothetical protein